MDSDLLQKLARRREINQEETDLENAVPVLEKELSPLAPIVTQLKKSNIKRSESDRVVGPMGSELLAKLSRQRVINQETSDLETATESVKLDMTPRISEKKSVTLPRFPENPNADNAVEKLSPSPKPVARKMKPQPQPTHDPIIKTKEENQKEYMGKLNRFPSDIGCLFQKLSNFDGVPMENCVGQYLEAQHQNQDFMDWFRNVYSKGKVFSLVNEIIDRYGHKITIDYLNKEYDALIKAKNKKILDQLPQSMKYINCDYLSKFLDITDLDMKGAIPRQLDYAEVDERKLWTIISKKADYTMSEIRMLMIELCLPSVEMVRFLRELINNPDLGPYLKEALPNGTITMADIRCMCSEYIAIEDVVDVYKKECCVCSEEFPMNMLRSFLACTHEFCKRCFKVWLEDSILNKYPNKWNCPQCNDEVQFNKNLHYSGLKDFMIENGCSQEICNIFDEKLLNESLRKTSTFHNCANDRCTYGFEVEGDNPKIQCPKCGLYTCVKCDRQWTNEHEDLTCEEYDMLMLKKDPNLAKLIGIVCPNCGMPYGLTPGGCLHFDCPQCAWKFCGGCYVAMSSNCKIVGCIQETGFHGHHPRNCFYHLRDYSVDELIKMLEGRDYPRLSNSSERKCSSLTSSEARKIEERCNDKVYKTTGLCENHCKEYLAKFINLLKVDPADTADANKLNMMLFQGLQNKLARSSNESTDAFTLRLRTEVVAKCPFYVPRKL